jgi:hypothetical protein
MNARLEMTRLGLIDVEFDVKSCKKQVTMIIANVEGCPKTTLGDLQGDQSEERCNYTSIFIIQGKVKKLLEYYCYRSFRKVKEDSWSTPEHLGVPCGYEFQNEYKGVPKQRIRQWNRHTCMVMCLLVWCFYSSWG